MEIHRQMLARSLLALALFSLAGCRQATGLNIPSDLVKLDPADGGILFIKEKEIKIGANKDFISFGSTDCEDFVCVRDSSYTKGNTDGGGASIDPEARAQGYCSRSCLPASDCPSQSADDDNKADTKLSCRPLLLDAETISAICTITPDAIFCGVKTPFFCARGSSGDAGI